MLIFGLALAALSIAGVPQDPPAAVLGDEVTVGFKATSGETVVDSTEERPPLVLELGKRDLIQGYVQLPMPSLDKGIVGMHVGDSRTIEVPGSELFPGLQVGGLKSDAPMKFEVKLLYLQKPGATPAIAIEELAPGEGPEAKAGDSVEVHYRGTFLNGVGFDNSYDRGQPFTVKLGGGQVIKGFDQGLVGMKTGGKRRVTIPYQLAYGAQGRGGGMPPKSTLVFELEVMSIKSGQ
ncbi:MAG: FKBP-type peptidyl-prolyl cis-trans isomerase [Fimbriimonadaceae bacterium]|nr:FKBP-type peptidyl-prolyl cis-trans isomerase [Fimbriimonadaceae bacterium]